MSSSGPSFTNARNRRTSARATKCSSGLPTSARNATFRNAAAAEVASITTPRFDVKKTRFGLERKAERRLSVSRACPSRSKRHPLGASW
jgi:hypothetical protein